MKQKGKSSEQENLFELHDRTSNWICKFEMQIDLFGRKTTVWNFYVQDKLLTISIDVADEKKSWLNHELCYSIDNTNLSGWLLCTLKN